MAKLPTIERTVAALGQTTLLPAPLRPTRALPL
jgi:hypothetical protein